MIKFNNSEVFEKVNRLEKSFISEKDNTLSFANDIEKMRDFITISKNEFLKSYSYLTAEEYEATQEDIDCNDLPMMYIQVEEQELTIPLELPCVVDIPRFNHECVLAPNGECVFVNESEEHSIKGELLHKVLESDITNLKLRDIAILTNRPDGSLIFLPVATPNPKEE